MDEEEKEPTSKSKEIETEVTAGQFDKGLTARMKKETKTTRAKMRKKKASRLSSSRQRPKRKRETQRPNHNWLASDWQ